MQCKKTYFLIKLNHCPIICGFLEQYMKISYFSTFCLLFNFIICAFYAQAIHSRLRNWTFPLIRFGFLIHAFAYFMPLSMVQGQINLYSGFEATRQYVIGDFIAVENVDSNVTYRVDGDSAGNGPPVGTPVTDTNYFTSLSDETADDGPTTARPDDPSQSVQDSQSDAQAQSPSLVNFRGQLLNSTGQPVTSTVSVDLRVFPSENGGAQLYLENIGNVEVINGQYAFQFGSNGSPDFTSVIRQNSETWVEITLNGDVLPRQRFVSVPYALSAGNAQVSPGSITRDMLSQDVQLDLNQTTNVAPGSVTTSMLSDTILKYLKPEITLQPSLGGQVSNGQSVSLSGQAEGKYLTYQWKKNGNNLVGETNQILTISDANASQHDGNYTLGGNQRFWECGNHNYSIKYPWTTKHPHSRLKLHR